MSFKTHNQVKANEVKGAAEDRGRIISKLASVNTILFVLQEQADQSTQDDQWSSTLQSLNVPKGPLDQFKSALERLSFKLALPATPLRKLGKEIVWPFQKEEIIEISEWQKALLILARQNDHMQDSPFLSIFYSSKLTFHLLQQTLKSH